MMQMIESLRQVDTAVFYFFNKTIAVPMLDGLMPVITLLGDKLVVVFGCLFLAIFGSRRVRRASIIAFISVFIAILIYVPLRQFLKVPRPFITLPDVRLLAQAGGIYGFPSGHAAKYFAFAFVLARKIPETRFAALILGVLVAISRMYLGVHYPSDVIAGIILGSFVAWVVCRVEECSFKKYLRKG